MESHGLIIIRTDANEEIATGHMMRCFTIAQKLLTLDTAILFVVSDSVSKNFFTQICPSFYYPTNASSIRTDKIGLVQLNTPFHQLDSEYSEMKELVTLFHPSVILLDSYFITHPYLAYLESLCPVTYIDDLQKFDYPVTAIINYDLHPNIRKYSANHVMLGGKYCPLREQFTKIDYKLKEQVTHIFLSTGGSDSYHIALTFLSLIFSDKKYTSLSQYQYHVIVGSMNKDKESLLSLSSQNPNIILYENVKDMASLMACCDIALTAGGTTLYELCALGIPTLTFSMADNQIGPATDFAQEHATYYIGDCRTQDNFYPSLLSTLHRFIQSYDVRHDQHKNMTALIDGLGTQRIADYLLSF